jgi:hypothetical protein
LQNVSVSMAVVNIFAVTLLKYTCEFITYRFNGISRNISDCEHFITFKYNIFLITCYFTYTFRYRTNLKLVCNI